MKRVRLLLEGTSLTDIGDRKWGHVRPIGIECLMARPHSILWSDQILIPKGSVESIQELYASNKTILDSYLFVIDELSKHGILKNFDPSTCLSSRLAEAVIVQVKKDEKRWSRKMEKDPKTGKSDRANIYIDDLKICGGRLGAAYATLALAREFDAGMYLCPETLYVCRKRFGEISQNKYADPFGQVFNALVPDVRVLGEYAEFYPYDFRPKNHHCDNCAHEDDCRKSCMDQTENNLNMLLEMRLRDEMTELKKRLGKAIFSYPSDKDLDAKSILAQLRNEEIRCKKRMKQTFPKIERWAAITALISTEAALLGSAFGNSLISGVSVAGAVPTGLSLGSVEYLKSKYQWVGFVEELRKLGASRRTGRTA